MNHASPPLTLSEQHTLNAQAMQHREGWRVFHADDQADIRYAIAPLPYGQVAMRMTAAYRCGDNHHVSIPWRLYTSRAEALQAFIEQAMHHFTIPCSTDQQQTQKRMLALLRGIHAGFQEPAPEPVQDEKPVETQVEKVKAKREKPTQRELF